MFERIRTALVGAAIVLASFAGVFFLGALGTHVGVGTALGLLAFSLVAYYCSKVVLVHRPPN